MLRRPAPFDRAAYLAYFEAWLAPKVATGELSATKFGYFAVGEPSFLTRLRDGSRKIRPETLERAIAYCENYKA